MRRNHTDEFKQAALQQLEQGLSLRRVAMTLGVSKNSLMRWRNQTQPIHPMQDASEDFMPTNQGHAERNQPQAMPESNHPDYQPDARREEPAEPLSGTETQVETARLMLDRRRLYDDRFKQEALHQIRAGSSIRQLSLALGVTQVTLHKWKKEMLTGRIDKTSPQAYQNEASFLESAPPEKLPADLTYLREKVRSLEEELDILKKAMSILLRHR